jgi:hypothetical protein
MISEIRNNKIRMNIQFTNNSNINKTVQRLASFGIIIPEEVSHRRNQTVEGLLRESLSTANKERETVAHLLCEDPGWFDCNTLRFLTEDALKCVNLYGRTPAHLAAAFDHLRAVPRRLLTQEIVEQPDHNGDTPIHFAAGRLRLHDLPGHLLTFKNVVEMENAFEVTPLDNIFDEMPDYVGDLPWTEMVPSKWLKGLDWMRVYRRLEDRQYPDLLAFIPKVELFQFLKQEPGITL